MIAIVDYGMGNLRSVEKGFERFGFKARVTDNHKELESADKLVLPGVGAFQDAMDGLKQRGLTDTIVDCIKSGKPFLGTCLGIIPGEVVRFKFSGNGTNGKLKIPHMGWNNINLRKPDNPLLKNVPENAFMYFVHSYYVRPEDNRVVATETEYGVRFASMIWDKNIFASQFHPEKSQKYGLAILKNFGDL